MFIFHYPVHQYGPSDLVVISSMVSSDLLEPPQEGFPNWYISHWESKNHLKQPHVARWCLIWSLPKMAVPISKSVDQLNIETCFFWGDPPLTYETHIYIYVCMYIAIISPSMVPSKSLNYSDYRYYNNNYIDINNGNYRYQILTTS